VSASRDRDPAGRPRNARPRDELGRPLPRTAADADGADRVPDDLAVTPGEAAVLGGSLLAEGRPFHAHEVFEAAWKSAPDADGAVTLLRRGAAGVRGYAGDPPGIDPGFVAASADDIANRIERDGLAAVPAASLLFPLRPGVSGG
jgi:hypothetical protein